MSQSTENSGGQVQIPPEFQLTPDESVEAAPVAAEEPQNQTWQLLREMLETIVLAVVIFLIVRQGVQNYRIESHSMEPNFSENQFVLVNKLAYRFGEPKQGDVLVFHNPDNPAEDYIKRVVALPGETISFNGGSVYINGEELVENMIVEPTYGPGGDIVIGPDALFVMGDNRDNSRDSRAFGQLDDQYVVGKAWLRIWPLDQFGLVDHQTDEDYVVPRDE